MKIAMINGSPKSKDSASGKLLNQLKTCFGAEVTFEDVQLNTPLILEAVIHKLNEFDVLLFSFPLYVDGIPSHFLSCLETMKEVGFSNKNIIVYCVSNCGFYEGKQNANAIDILHNWSRKVGLTWGSGLGIGAGATLAAMDSVPLGKGPKKSIGLALQQFATIIEKHASTDNIYVTADFPRFLYKLGAHVGWKQQIKANGGKAKDLNYRY